MPSPRDRFIEDISRIIPMIFDRAGEPTADVVLVLNDPKRSADLEAVFDEKPWLGASANNFVKGLIEHGIEPVEVIAFLGFGMTASLNAAIEPTEESRLFLAMDLAAAASRITRFAEQIALRRS
jgi:hypothetical protein